MISTVNKQRRAHNNRGKTYFEQGVNQNLAVFLLN